MAPALDPVWEHFETSGKHYSRNASKNEAWCKYCIAPVKQRIRSEEGWRLSAVEATPQMLTWQMVDEETGMVMPCTPEMFEEWVTEKARTAYHPRCGDPLASMYPHLAHPACIAPATVKQWARETLLAKRLESARRKAHGENAAHHSVDAASESSPQLSATSSFNSLGDSGGLPGPPRLKRHHTESQPHTQEAFETDILYLFVMCGIPWAAAENVEWLQFFQKWVPGMVVPSRKVLSGRILDEEAVKVESAVRRRTEGRLAVGQQDGWKDIAKESINATMMTVDGEPYLISTHGGRHAERKTGENLWKQIREDIIYAQLAFAVCFIAWVSDNGPDARKMRRLLVTEMPWFIVLCCWAHQINLIVGDYLKVKTLHVQVLNEALEVIKWFNNHGFWLALLDESMQADHVLKGVLALLLPVVTRWTAHYCSAARLLRVSLPLRACALQHRQQLLANLGNDQETIAKGEWILDLIKDDSWWVTLAEIKMHLEPLAIAANICQAANTRLDTVLLTLANLYCIFSAPHILHEIQLVIHNSLEKRWAATDQDTFIATLFLNPYVRHNAFRPGNIINTINSMSTILSQLYTRMFQAEPEPGFLGAIGDYWHRRGEFSDSAMHLETRKHTAELTKVPIDVLEIWTASDTGVSGGRNTLVQLGIRLYSIIPHSAASERDFSQMGIIHSKLRNRLSSEKVHKTVQVKAERAREQRDNGTTVRRRLKRRFGIPDPDLLASAMDTSQAPTADEVMHSLHEPPIEDESDEDETAIRGHEPPTTSQAPSMSSRDFRETWKRDLRLENLFTYPAVPENGEDSCPLAFYWHGGVHTLQEEVEYYELLTGDPVAVDE